jgi:hypothetical protein
MQIQLKSLLLLFLLTAQTVTSIKNKTSDYDDELIEDEGSRTKTRAVKKTTTASATTASDDYYDDEDYANQAQSSGEDETNAAQPTRPPYTCPAQCKCTFDKQNPLKTTSSLTSGGKSSNVVNSEDYDDTSSSSSFDYKHKARKHKRFVVSRTASSKNASELEEYDDEETSTSETTTSSVKPKYDITVNCAKQGLTAINSLFDYDFPLDQIVNL